MLKTLAARPLARSLIEDREAFSLIYLHNFAHQCLMKNVHSETLKGK